MRRLLILTLAATAACRRQPELTQARVIEDLGKDELAIHFWTELDEQATRTKCESKPGLLSVDGERDAAAAAGWIERICPEDPDRMRLTAEGRARSARWEKYEPETAPRIAWTAIVARYERSGAPIIPSGPPATEEDSRLPMRMVKIPGRYVPNEDGARLAETGWPRIRVVDREERFVLWHGIWARRHGE